MDKGVCKYSTFRFFKKILKKRFGSKYENSSQILSNFQSKFESPTRFNDLGIFELKSKLGKANFYEFEDASHHLYLDKISQFNTVINSLKNEK
jgi:hypothetical protein